MAKQDDATAAYQREQARAAAERAKFVAPVTQAVGRAADSITPKNIGTAAGNLKNAADNTARNFGTLAGLPKQLGNTALNKMTLTAGRVGSEIAEGFNSTQPAKPAIQRAAPAKKAAPKENELKLQPIKEGPAPAAYDKTGNTDPAVIQFWRARTGICASG